MHKDKNKKTLADDYIQTSLKYQDKIREIKKIINEGEIYENLDNIKYKLRQKYFIIQNHIENLKYNCSTKQYRLIVWITLMTEKVVYLICI